MKAYVFPGQGSQFEGMGKDMFAANPQAQYIFEEANDILGYKISDMMFAGSADDLKQTKVTQPAIFIHSVIKAFTAGDAFQPHAVAGHSLGEFSALVAAGALTFEDGLRLVQKRALAMQHACEISPGTMAAIVGLDDAAVEKICKESNGLVVAANYNCPGQLVISGSLEGVEDAVARCKAAGVRTAVMLQVGGAFHSPLMEIAKADLEEAIINTPFKSPTCPIYQNVNAEPQTNARVIKKNLIAQLTSPVLWTQTIQNMLRDGITHFTEVGGTGTVLRGMIKRVNKTIPSEAL
jgi:[acyl-carrier-protein] S-malonyltransferase